MLMMVDFTTNRLWAHALDYDKRLGPHYRQRTTYVGSNTWFTVKCASPSICYITILYTLCYSNYFCYIIIPCA